MNTLEKIREIRELKRKELDIRVNSQVGTKEKHILVCHGTGCTSSKSPKIIENFRKIIKEKKIRKCTRYTNRLFWFMCKRTNSYYKTRRYILCNGITRRL